MLLGKKRRILAAAILANIMALSGPSVAPALAATSTAGAATGESGKAAGESGAAGAAEAAAKDVVAIAPDAAAEPHFSTTNFSSNKIDPNVPLTAGYRDAFAYGLDPAVTQSSIIGEYPTVGLEIVGRFANPAIVKDTAGAKGFYRSGFHINLADAMSDVLGSEKRQDVLPDERNSANPQHWQSNQYGAQLFNYIVYTLGYGVSTDAYRQELKKRENWFVPNDDIKVPGTNAVALKYKDAAGNTQYKVLSVAYTETKLMNDNSNLWNIGLTYAYGAFNQDLEYMSAAELAALSVDRELWDKFAEKCQNVTLTDDSGNTLQVANIDKLVMIAGGTYYDGASNSFSGVRYSYDSATASFQNAANTYLSNLVIDGGNGFAYKYDTQSDNITLCVYGENFPTIVGIEATGANLERILADWQNERILGDAAQAALLTAATGSDSAAVDAWMEEYLPSLCFVQLPEADIAALKAELESLTDEAAVRRYLETGPAYAAADPALTDLSAHGGLQLGYGLGDKGSAAQKARTYSYGRAAVPAGKTWRPLDRTLAYTSRLGDYYIRSASWLTNSDGSAIAAGDAGDVWKGTPVAIKVESDTLIKGTPITAITVGELTLGEGSSVDLSYANTVGANANGLGDENGALVQKRSPKAGEGYGNIITVRLDEKDAIKQIKRAADGSIVYEKEPKKAADGQSYLYTSRDVPIFDFSQAVEPTEAGAVKFVYALHGESTADAAKDGLYYRVAQDAAGQPRTENKQVLLFDCEYDYVTRFETAINRNLIADKAKLADGAAFRLGVYTNKFSTVDSKKLIGRYGDAVYLREAEAVDAKGEKIAAGQKNTLYLGLGYVPEIITGAWNGSCRLAGYDETWKQDSPGLLLLGIYEGADAFNVKAQKTLADGIFDQYEITPEIREAKDYFHPLDAAPHYEIVAENDLGQRTHELVNGQGTAYFLTGYTYRDTGKASESVKNSKAAAEATHNFATTMNLGAFDRFEALHTEGFAAAEGSLSPAPIDGGIKAKGRKTEDEVKEAAPAPADGGIKAKGRKTEDKVKEAASEKEKEKEKAKDGGISPLFGKLNAFADETAAAAALLKENPALLEAANREFLRAVEEAREERGELADEARENAWLRTSHHKASLKSGGTASLNSYQFGYDKLLSKKFYGGRVYAGVFGERATGSSSTASGGGEQKGLGFGLYASWIGDKGHFLDAVANAAKADNEYHFTAAGADKKTDADYEAWNYGFGLQYGKRNQLKNGTFWEPSLLGYLGHADRAVYDQITDGVGTMHIREGSYNTLIAKAAVKLGSNVFKDKGNIYTKLGLAHEFLNGRTVTQSVPGQARSGQIGGRDTWLEWDIGTVVKISPAGILNLGYNRSFGGSYGNAWGVNGSLRFTWGGFGDKLAAAGPITSEDIGAGLAYPAADSPTVVIGRKQTKEAEAKKARILAEAQEAIEKAIDEAAKEAETAPAVAAGEAKSSALALAPLRFAAKEEAAAEKKEAATPDENLATFSLEGLTVESRRPDWEKSLSPGQVSVIYPEAFEGEQKSLPDMLDTIPGLFVDKMNGDGHYNTARVRGSTAAQVEVYIDGVKANLSGDAAVDLSAIPIDNVERIEVYRGYIPARFGGASMGGVVNIVTKRPKELSGRISQGFKSYGGYKATYEASMPLGSGSLLATFGRDLWHGDFDWTAINIGYWNHDYKGQKTTEKRRSNAYQKSDAMLKWQDDHWTVKSTWRKGHEGLARDTGNIVMSHINSVKDYRKGYGDVDQEITYRDFMVGRRDTIGNLDIGWHLAYIDSQKEWRNTGWYKYVADNGSAPNNTNGSLTSDPEDCWVGSVWSKYRSKKWDGNLNLAMKLGTNHLLEFNADIIRETMDCNGNNWKNFRNEMPLSTYTTVYRKMLDKYNNREYHLTLQDTVTLNTAGDFKLTPKLSADKVAFDGLQDNTATQFALNRDISDDDAKWKYSAGLALQKQLDKHWSFKTTWGTYNHHPNFYQIFGDGISIGQSDALHNGKDLWEKGRQFDFSLNWQGEMAKADTDTILTYFVRRSENQMVLYTPERGYSLPLYRAGNNIKAHGFELTHNMKWKRFGLNLAATWQRSENISVDEYNFGDNYSVSNFSYVPEWLLRARLDYAFPKEKLALFAEYQYNGNETLCGWSSKPGTHHQAAHKYAYSIFNLGAKYKFDKHWRPTAGINDVFNKGRNVFLYIPSQEYYDTQSNLYPLSGRMYYATLECNF